MNCLGTMLERGEGCKQSSSAAADWYRRAASAAHLDAKVNLGILLTSEAGAGSPDHEHGNALFIEAIEGGSIRALHGMGLSHFHGRGVEQNTATALSYSQRAADQGHAGAATCVGEAYWKSPGGYAKSLQLAKKYTKISAAQGDPLAIANLKLMTACAQCGTISAPGVCAGCKQVHYCNRACQLLHWCDPVNPHKAHCGGISAQDSRWRASDRAWLAAHTPLQQ